MFHLSLSSKELFHSNLLAWLAEDSDTRDLFVGVLELFGLEDLQAKKLADGIRGNEYMVLREYKNFDFCICEKLKNWKEDSDEEYVPGQVVLVLENKFKSIPYEAQLTGYEEKVEGLNKEGMKNKKKSWYWKENNVMPQKWSDKFYKGEQIDKVGCHFVLLTLNKEVCGLQLTDNGGKKCCGKWPVVSYKEYAEVLRKDETIKKFKHEIICDYADYVKNFCDYIYPKLQVLDSNDLLKKNWKEVLCSDKGLRSIRMDDIWQKLVANIVLKQLRLKAEGLKWETAQTIDPLINENTGQVHVGAGFSRGTALIEIKIRIGDGCLFGVQIQNGLYKRFLEAPNVKNEDDREKFYKGKLDKLQGLELFRYGGDQWEETEKHAVDNVLTGDVSPKAEKNGKAGLQGFGGYGTTFLAQWMEIGKDATVKNVIEKIIKDCSKVKNKLNL